MQLFSYFMKSRWRMDINAHLHKKALIFTVISKYFVYIFNFASFEYFMSLS